MKLNKIKLEQPSEYNRLLAELFASNVIETNKDVYKGRNEASEHKIRTDIMNGKIAEILVCKAFIKQNKAITPPDFLIYGTNEKKFDADLFSNDLKIHVKSCMNDGKFPNSWLFQKTDPVYSSPQTKNFLCLVVLGEQNYMYVVGAISAKQHDLYSDPVKHMDSKQAIYESRLLGGDG
jgi:hypothetical protein